MMTKKQIGRQISLQMKRLKLNKFNVSAFAKVERTQLDKLIAGNGNYTIETLLRVLKTVNLDLHIIRQKITEPENEVAEIFEVITEAEQKISLALINKLSILKQFF